MNKELSKSVMQKSKARNKYLDWPSRENFLNYKKVINKCNAIVKKSKRTFSKILMTLTPQLKNFRIQLSLFYQLKQQQMQKL